MSVCKRIHYWGKVQGVGFRYTTLGIARQHPVTGYVKNLLDGQVELVAEGSAEAVDRFVAAVEARMAGYIQGHRVTDEAPENFAEFSIRS